MSSHTPPAERSRLFFGWRIVAVAFFVDFVAVGFFFYSYGVFFKAIAAEFGDSRLGVALGLTVTQTVGALAAPMIGRALDRFPIRRVIGAGALAMSLGFLGLSQVTSQVQFYLVLGAFIGIGAGSMGGLATAKLVTNWFEARRGFALGIAATGISLSGVVMPAVTAAIIEGYGWRSAFLLYAAFTALVVIPVVLRWVVSRPEDIGLLPDGIRVARPATAPLPRLASAAILKLREFWVLVAALGLIITCQSATLTHLVPRVTDMGFTLLEASMLMSICAGAGVIGKMTFGWLIDRTRPRNALLTSIATQVLGQVVMLAAGSGYAAFAIGAFTFGLGMGGFVPLQGALVARRFGRDAFGRALGMMRPAMLPLQVIGVPFAGWVFDRTGSYDFAFQCFLAIYLLAALVVYFGLAHPGRQPVVAGETGA